MIDSEYKEFCCERLELFDSIFETSIAKYSTEILENNDLLTLVENRVAGVDGFKRKKWDESKLWGIYRIFLYCLVRDIKPLSVLETGVLHGFSSLLILTALRENRRGRLISVDLPSYFESGPANDDGFIDVLPKGQVSGWVVPDYLKDYWLLELGESKVVLDQIFSQGTSPEIFIHDSEHTYQNMMSELTTAWDGQVIGSFLIADNIDVNSSFFDFAAEHGRVCYVCSADPDDNTSYPPIRFGAIRK